MMNREDVLRELELLPVWQLRNPTPVTTENAQMESVVAEPVVEARVKAQVIEVPQAQQCRLIVSDDAQWAFILAPQQSEEAEVLLQNMLKAVSVNVNIDTADLAYLDQHAPKVIVVMGEAEAQQLLNEKSTLEQLRGKAHQYQSMPVIATYAPSHLLAHLQDKAKAWEDLCLAKFTIASL